MRNCSAVSRAVWCVLWVSLIWDYPVTGSDDRFYAPAKRERGSWPAVGIDGNPARFRQNLASQDRAHRGSRILRPHGALVHGDVGIERGRQILDAGRFAEKARP